VRVEQLRLRGFDEAAADDGALEEGRAAGRGEQRRLRRLTDVIISSGPPRKEPRWLLWVSAGKRSRTRRCTALPRRDRAERR